MPSIVTLTVNPTIDDTSEAELVRPVHKIRTHRGRIDPGGGGVNVARVVHRLGGDVEAIVCLGGATGALLDELLEREGVKRSVVSIAGATRMAHVVFETATGQEYRFVPEGPTLSEEEQNACFKRVEETECDYFVASGSLAPGVSEDFYPRIAEMVTKKGAKFVLDTSGLHLSRTLAGNNVLLAKPSIGELGSIVGQDLHGPKAAAVAARDYVQHDGVGMLAVTLGRHGALLVTPEETHFCRPPEVKTRSASGAGDSFLAAMVLAISQGRTPDDALRLATASGAATALTPGTALCYPEDVEGLYEEISTQRIWPADAQKAGRRRSIA
ncbi:MULTISPECIES: 1-phosphofructokinase family hexose kinase [Afifella]|uniref:1-phosphofructokinase family hexose kinase n=1 Tax=Afifella TaxID=643217 RepID=UPI000FE2C1BE|nr:MULTISPECIES: 1-phosphofructokinase family hexose kinase [Afifella]MCT8266950.1 1-phosphofructokinase family hexose kinase [Afifella sp. JA880]